MYTIKLGWASMIAAGLAYAAPVTASPTDVSAETAASPIAQEVIRGTWDTDHRDRSDQTGVHIHLRGRRNHSSSLHLEPSEQRALADALRSGRDFVLEREAGALTLHVDQPRQDEGDFALVVAPNFMDRMDQLGYRFRNDRELLSAALLDVGPAWATEVERAGLVGLDTDDLFATRIFEVDTEFVDQLAAAGLSDLDVDKYVAFRVHGVSPEWVRDIRAELEGSADADDLVAMRVHGVSPIFLTQMRELSIALDADDAVALRVHGVGPEDVRDLQELGLDGLTADDLVEFRIHGVDRRLRKRRRPSDLSWP